MSEYKEALLKKVYYENCPGCKVDQRKEAGGVPYKELCFVFFVLLCAALPISSIFPFLYFMIRDLHVAEREEDIGYYAGYVGSAFMFGRALTSVFWGVVADRYGRKRAIMIGTITMVIFNILFGLSTCFWMAVVTRFLLGSMNGFLGPIRAYASEICRKEYQTLGLSTVSTSWGIGLIIGPALGGLLAQPAEKYPNIFSKESLFGRFPYLLPCLIISIFAMGATIVSSWLPETLHIHNEDYTEGHCTVDDHDMESPLNVSDAKEKSEEIKQEPPSKKSLLKNWPLMSSLIAYGIFSLHDMAYTEIFSLWAVSPRKFGGLSYSTKGVGEVLAVSGFGLLIFQMFVYPRVSNVVGPIIVSRIFAILSIPLLSSYPFIAMLSGSTLALLITCASVLKNVFSVSITTGLFLLQNNAVPQHQRGAANGISLTAMSLFKAVGPAVGGAVFSWAQNRQDASFLPGDHMVFFILNVIEGIGLLMTFKPFLAQPSI
ncbi:protein ZINC INDUCED FACILITATOR-LIKE 1-like isoform X1 [Macadamia integrifolia]|uniref:protein ZINC INDUCED FACILITATOR-LIKE 1-like isoform X1 n=1 Tax=Macadamia integrifolia TaxID=60698 RepID=UPI001C4F6B91|nr:protein ZINC INDUCED FACILITATOR-LIKE 1-like isoform X1 [Macadamia integrifolia]XP_042514243.1 protein ZINC INDUCED FACILITATOR-LIKE 1-like isoform X1 [Macadamia integrifolia]XP_042514244.1 protein ZINC INDUCED FACILITATOR-LIKE 1-like isoform X1 [Macadamia integrifolia]XP_042514245.1 protein ZINC INDUCED FACILITATOR-LIKE 1-like isoform X1 [Macadamia integrifolia]